MGDVAMPDRQNELLRLLEQNGSLTIRELSARLYASESTVRRDIAKLEKQKLIVHSAAGIMLLNLEQGGVSLAYSLKTHEKEKKLIARRAAELVQDKSTVFLASASATFFMIPHLARKRGITIVTDGLAHAQKAAEYGLATICLGGMIDSSAHCTQGLFAEDMLTRLHTDIAFFSVPHVSSDGRLWHHRAEKVRILQLMMQHTSRSVLLCNSHKIDDIKETYLLCHTEELDMIVSDRPLPTDFPAKSSLICSGAE